MDFNIGHGAVGGKVIDRCHQGFVASGLGTRILNGKNAEDIPVVDQGARRYIFDYRKLRKFNISLNALPGDGKIINRPAITEGIEALFLNKCKQKRVSL